jgi:hypothetical protein
MISGRIYAVIMAGALFSGGGLNAALAQQPADPLFGRVYSFHSQANGTCPSLDWHTIVQSNGTISGVIGTDNMSTVFRVSGTVANRKFHLDGKEIGGQGRTSTIDGEVRQDGWLVADISNVTGPSLCNNHIVTVQWYRYDTGTAGNG